jgi:hypothetical protein
MSAKVETEACPKECYEPAFIIVKPRLGSVRIAAKRTAGEKAWPIFRV